jgi:hypothetical protein
MVTTMVIGTPLCERLPLIISTVYAQRFTAHLWNNVRSSRLRLHQVIRKNCQILLSSSDMRNHAQWKFQKADSESKIIEFAIEVTASVPQLAGYLEQLEMRRLNKGTYPLRLSDTLTGTEAPDHPRLEKITGPGTMEYTSHFGNAPSPFRRGDTPTSPQSTPHLAPQPAPQLTTKPLSAAHRKPSTMSMLYSDCNDPETHTDKGPTRSTSPPGGPQPASVYHMLFQLYSLSRITMLPAPFRSWVQNRISWMENISDPEDLARLQDLVSRRPGDGFPVDNEG